MHPYPFHNDILFHFLGRQWLVRFYSLPRLQSPPPVLHQNILARVSAVVLAFIAQDTSTCFPALVAFATELYIALWADVIKALVQGALVVGGQ